MSKWKENLVSFTGFFALSCVWIPTIWITSRVNDRPLTVINVILVAATVVMGLAATFGLAVIDREMSDMKNKLRSLQDDSWE